MNIEIKDASGEDVDGIRYVLKTTWLDTYPNEELGITKEDIEQRFDDSTPEAQERLARQKQNINTKPDRHEWVAKDGQVVGWCLALRGEENHIQTLYILPEYQGKGAGGKLLTAALGWIGKDKEVSLNVASYNQNAIGFYERYGFVNKGEAAQNDLPPFPSGAVIPEITMVKKASE